MKGQAEIREKKRESATRFRNEASSQASESKVENCTNLHLPSQSLENVPEDLHTELEDLTDGRDGVSTETEAEVLLGRLNEGGSGRARRGDENLRGGEETDVGLEDGEDEVEGEEFGSHRVRFDVAFAGRKGEESDGGKRSSARAI